jgi:hypothetical protein
MIDTSCNRRLNNGLIVKIVSDTSDKAVVMTQILRSNKKRSPREVGSQIALLIESDGRLKGGTYGSDFDECGKTLLGASPNVNNLYSLELNIGEAR